MTSLIEIIRVITPLLLGGVIGSIASLRWKVRTERYKSEQEKSKIKQQNATSEQAELTADSMQLQNTAELINLYREAIRDIGDYKSQLQENYQTQINTLGESIKKLQDQIGKYESELKKKEDIISKLSSNQKDLQEKLNSLQERLEVTCDQCIFRTKCPKYSIEHEK